MGEVNVCFSSPGFKHKVGGTCALNAAAAARGLARLPLLAPSNGKPPGGNDLADAVCDPAPDTGGKDVVDLTATAGLK